MAIRRFDLHIAVDPHQPVVHLRLCDDSGREVAEHTADIARIRASLRDGLFDLREHVQRYAQASAQEQAVVDVGVCIAEQILGDPIMAALWRPEHQRTLRIQLPGASDAGGLAAALARVPWEIARPAADQPTLAERNLLVRVVHDMSQPASLPLQLLDDEPLRLLFVFADARGSRPLAARAERRAFEQLLRLEVYPHRRVEAHVLCHGVTRDRLREIIRDQGGFHLLHWSGHGHLNLLELAGRYGQPDHLSGRDLLAMFHEAGGFLPRLAFLSACHSGDFLHVSDWTSFQAAASGEAVGAVTRSGTPPALAQQEQEAPFDFAGLERKLDTTEPPGFTGTAHALLQGGIPTVVAMRYAVSDDYARDLALEFYRALLADTKTKSPASALTMARRALLSSQRQASRRYAVCDHATPLLYGEEQPGLSIPAGISPQLALRDPCLHDIGEFHPQAHLHFVGRAWELATLGAAFIGTARDQRTHAAALIVGLGGMGKTALVAEALTLWRHRFRWVLLYQAKPNRLELDAMLRDIHRKLMDELGAYHEHVTRHRADAIHREAEPDFEGPVRIDRLAKNLLGAMTREPILLVLDNFETQLGAPAAGGVDAPCFDPSWDRLLSVLATGLAGTPSRLLVTSRRPPAALSPERTCRLPLGPLPALEAAHFLRQHPLLSGWLFSTDPAQRRRAQRLLDASRFHPLLMDRLARLADQPDGEAALEGALAALEGRLGHAKLPALFAARPGDEVEQAYLESALVVSIDRLVAELPREGRQALWLVALTNQPELGVMLDAAWAHQDDPDTAELREYKARMELDLQDPKLRESWTTGPRREVFEELSRLPPRPSMALPPLGPLLRRLEMLGLISRSESASKAVTPPPLVDVSETTANKGVLAYFWSCHELVRERIAAWMEQHPDDRGDCNSASWQRDLAAQLQRSFTSLLHQNMNAALIAGTRAIVYAVQAGDWARLNRFASAVVNSSRNPALLQDLLPHLQWAVDAAPEGDARRTCLLNLADALDNGGRHKESLPFYDQAIAMSRDYAQANGEQNRFAWSGLAIVLGNSGSALLGIGDLNGARERQTEAADAMRRAGREQVYIVSCELEILRIDLKQDKLKEVASEIESRLALVEGWWRAHLSGREVPEASDLETLARSYIGALDIARQAAMANGDLESALRHVDATIEAKTVLNRSSEEIAGTRMNRANILIEIPDRFNEAKSELESCLQIAQGNPNFAPKVLGSLAILYARQEDWRQAVTLLRRVLTMCEAVFSPELLATTHSNLASYLQRLETSASSAEASRHQLAALVYALIAQLNRMQRSMVNGYFTTFVRARRSGKPVEVPRLSDLLNDPAFDLLSRWLKHSRIDAVELQDAVDHVIGSAKAAAENPP